MCKVSFFFYLIALRRFRRRCKGATIYPHPAASGWRGVPAAAGLIHCTTLKAGAKTHVLIVDHGDNVPLPRRTVDQHTESRCSQKFQLRHHRAWHRTLPVVTQESHLPLCRSAFSINEQTTYLCQHSLTHSFSLVTQTRLPHHGR